MKTFEELFAELQRKAAARDPRSGTVRELEAGTHAIGKKLVEEAHETAMAAQFQGPEQTAVEASQLLYHVQVMLIACGLTLEDVYHHL
ncbi:MAG: phosphoribosyl-ATP diphosphatase [Planctomycetes bacterium]|nr:phosphoribosyl-ATP diphosphatase [Planctomycetota bacterium]